MENMKYSPPNILIVDDVNANLAVLTEMIRKAGYIARPVTSARQAVSAIEAMTPSLILLDISMPEVDGFVFCSMLKKNANTRDIPVIFITALNSTEDKIRGFQLGAVDYISKPFEVEEVTMRINTHLKMYKMQQELEVYNKKLYKIINEQIQKISDGQKNVVQALVLLCGMRDKRLADFFYRVGNNSRILALSLQLSSKFKEQITNSFIDVIEVAALLHDLGFAIMDYRCFDAMDEASRAEKLMEHTAIGAKLMEEIYQLGGNNEYLKMAIDIAKYHHENWDGSGYSLGLSGKDIPLCARIVTVITTYDNWISCMKNQEPVDKAHESGVERVNLAAGTVLDPDIVAIFNKIQNQFIR